MRSTEKSLQEVIGDGDAELAAIVAAGERDFQVADEARTNLQYFMRGSEGARRLEREPGSKPLSHDTWSALVQRICSARRCYADLPFVHMVLCRLIRFGIEDLEWLSATSQGLDEARKYAATLRRLFSPTVSSPDCYSGLTAARLEPMLGDRFEEFVGRLETAVLRLPRLTAPPAIPLNGAANSAPPMA